MGKTQVLQLGLKGLLARLYENDPDKMEKWMLERTTEYEFDSEPEAGFPEHIKRQAAHDMLRCVQWHFRHWPGILARSHLVGTTKCSLVSLRK